MQNDEIIENNAGSRYRIVIKGELDSDLEQWFEGMKLEINNGTTVITGTVLDQTELHGLLRRIHDLHLTLETVEKVI